MADDRKAQAGAVRSAVGIPTAPVPDVQVTALQKTVLALQQEIDALKRQSGLAGKVQVEGIFTGAPPVVTKPVQEVINQYVALERALLSPEPAWIYPGSSGNSLTGAAGS